jgi:cation transport ATPase
MRHAVCHCLCLLCLALLTHCEEHDNSTEEHHHLEGSEHEHLGHDHSSHEHDTHAERAHHPAHVRLEDARHVEDYRIWLAASGSILLISLCGIFGVIVIPIMQRVFYQHLIQFLIALAVGTLAGDALVHLLPHAILARLNAGR